MTAEALAAPRWRGQPNRIETWYATITDPASGNGYWLHAETLADDQGRGEAHGWLAAFVDGETPRFERFGPEAIERPPPGESWFAAAGCDIGPGWLVGKTDSFAWDLTFHDDGPPLATFPSWAWERELLPGAQVVPYPTATVVGELSIAGRRLDLRGARGNLAHIYGHGHAQRWGWLHADLGAGEVLEVVAATSRRPGLRLLPPLGFVQLRAGGRDWPGDALLAAPLAHARLGLPQWSLRATVGRRRLRLRVTLPPERCVVVPYRDPDGASVTCTNSERADADVILERWAGRWRPERSWSLRGTAHAEVGQRP